MEPLMKTFKILIIILLLQSVQLFAVEKDLCPGGSEVKDTVTTNEAKFVKCSDGKIYALWGGGINGSKLPPGYREITDRSWSQITGKEEGSESVVSVGAGGTTLSCSAECSNKWGAMNIKASKKLKECVQKCNLKPASIYGSYLANCELIGGGEFIRCPDDSLYQKTSTTFSEALRKGVQQKGEQPLQQGSGGFGISPGGFGF
jgi:hypothetical protein